MSKFVLKNQRVDNKSQRDCTEFRRVFLVGSPVFFRGLTRFLSWARPIFLVGSPDFLANSFNYVKKLGFSCSLCRKIFVPL